MSAVLKKIERKVGQAQDEQKTSSLTETLGDIRAGIEVLNSTVEKDISRDERISSLEKLLIRMYDALEKSEETRLAEDALETSAEQKECARLQSELNASKLECEQVEQLLAAMQATRLDDARIMGDLRAALAGSEVMCDAEKRAKIVAESSLAQAKSEHERHMQMMTEKQKPESQGEMIDGWSLKPIRDGADKLLRMDVVPLSKQ